MDELRVRCVVDVLRDRGVKAHLLRGSALEKAAHSATGYPALANTGRSRRGSGTMTPQQKALIAELRAADYPATWTLSASAADDKLVASATQIRTSEPA